MSPSPSSEDISTKITSLYYSDCLFDAHYLLVNLGPQQNSDFSPQQHPLYSNIIELYEFSYPLLKILQEPPKSRYSTLHYDKDGIQVRYYDGHASSHKSQHDSNVSGVVKEFYAKQQDEKMQSMWIKGTVECDFMLLIAVLHEVDLYDLWVPRLTGSRLLEQVSKFHFFCQFHWELLWPMADRNLWTEGIGIDRLRSDGEVLIAIREMSSHQTNVETSTLKEDSKGQIYPDGTNAVEMRCPYAAFLLKSLGPNLVELTLVSTVDPQIPYIPGWLRDMATKTASPMVIRKIREIVQKVETDDKYKEYLRRMQDTKKHIYQDIQDRLGAFESNRSDSC